MVISDFFIFVKSREIMGVFTNLQLLLLVMSVAIMLFSFSVYKRRRIGILPFLFFFCGAIAVGVFSLRIERLNAIGITFGLNRGADLLVYISIVALFYLLLGQYNKNSALQLKQTELIRKISMQNTQGKIEKSDIVFVIPAYNESDHCIQVVQEVLDAGYGVVFVDDGSNNGLFTRLQEAFREAKECVLIQHVINMGQGAALQTWFDYIQQQVPSCEFVVTFDSDGQHMLSDLPVFLQKFENDPALQAALWSRFLGKAVNIPTSKVIALKIWILFTFIFSGMWLTDTHNGYRVLRKSILPKIKLNFNGMEHASEILELIGQQNIKYIEVPNTILYTEYSMARGQKLSNSLRIVKNLMMSKFFGN